MTTTDQVLEGRITELEKTVAAQAEQISALSSSVVHLQAVTYRKLYPCPKCKGYGVINGPQSSSKCKICQGLGWDNDRIPKIDTSEIIQGFFDLLIHKGGLG